MLLSERSKSEEGLYCVIQAVLPLKKEKLQRQQENQWFPGAGGEQEWINRAQMIFMALYYQIDIIWYHNSGYMHYKPIQKQMYYNTKNEHLS